jgi:ABC-type cobalamin/Fe3+-siderophores transport system ATPase subunit
MKGKTELLKISNGILKMSIPTVEILQKEIQSLCSHSFLKIVKIEPANKSKVFL